MADRSRWARLLCGAAASAALGIGAAACSSGSSSSESLPSVATVAPSVVAGDAAASTVPALTASAVDGAALLQGALASMATGYHFTTTLTVNGVVVLSADGDRVGDGTRLAVTQGDVSVQYVITPAATWVQPEGGDWQLLDTASASADPIGALANPSAVEVTAIDGTATTVNASVSSAALGLGGGNAVTMSARIDNGAITSVGYDATIDGKPAIMQASIGPVVDGSPVVAPI